MTLDSEIIPSILTDQNENQISLSSSITAELAGKRLDQAVAKLFEDFSRSRLKKWIEDGSITVNGSVCRPRDKVSFGDTVQLNVVLEEQVECAPQDIPLNIVYEDDSLLVINKPANLVVHPAAGNPDGTIQNALLHHNPKSIELPRAGIVHRLDKDTTGLMVVAKTQSAHKQLVAALAAREVSREYEALVLGNIISGGTVDEPIGRHPTQRTRMAVNPMGKHSVTHYRVLQHLYDHTLLRVKLETGRTHQIRVHMAHIHHPIFGDQTYGGRLRLPNGIDDETKEILRSFKRQALHARHLSLVHPETGQLMKWSAPVPGDMKTVIAALAEQDTFEDDFDDGYYEWGEYE